MERPPEKSTRTKPLAESQLRYPETFGLEPMSYEREIPEAIRGLGDALHRFEREGGDEEVREIFAGVYSEELIEKDLAEVHRLERAYEHDDTLRERVRRVYALALEYIISDLSHAWFPECEVWRSFKFDDYKRQVDLFMDVPGRDDQPLTLGLDVVSGKQNSSNKIFSALDEYRSGNFHDVKYFASDTDPGRRKGFMLLPRVVVGASQHGIASLARAYGKYLHASGEEKKTELQRLQFHPLGGELYEELIRQVALAHTIMRRNLKDTPGKTARHAVLKEQAALLGAIRDALKERYQQWRQERKEYLKKDRDFAALPKTPVNDVLEAVLETA